MYKIICVNNEISHFILLGVLLCRKTELTVETL